MKAFPAGSLPAVDRHGTQPAGSARVVLAVLVAYVLFAEMAWGLFGADFGMAFFPAAGVTLAALVALPRRRWPLLLVVIMAAEVVVDLRHELRFPTALGYAAANCIEPVTGAVVMTWLARVANRPVAELHRRAGMLRFVAGGLIAGPLVGGLVGATVKVLDSPDATWFVSFAHWWAGDGLGVLAVGAPLLVAQRREAWDALRPRGEAVLLLALTAAVSVVVFAILREPLIYGLLPLLLWAAFRFEVLGVGIAGATAALIANIATAEGRGPFAALPVSPQTQLGLAQFFLASTIISGWFFAIETGERSRAVHRGRLETAARQLAETDRAVGAVGRELMSALQSIDIVDVVSCQLRSRLDADNVVIQRWDAAGGVFVPLHASRPSPQVDDFVGGELLSSPLSGPQAARTGEPVWASSGVEIDERFPAGAASRAALGIESLAALPLLVGDGGVGYLTVLWRRGRVLSDQERSYLGSVAQITGQSLDRARLHEAERTAARRFRSLHELTAALANAETVEAVRHIVERDARIALGAIDVHVVIGDEDQSCREPNVLASVAAGEISQVSLRLVGDVGALGMLHATFDDARRRGEADRDLVAAVADQCAQAVQRAQMRAAEHDAVVHLQRSLLAHTMDRSPHMSFSARYRPAASPLDVGGDWYDVIAVDRHRVMLIVGDVVGRGLSAAVTMAQVRSAARALASRFQPAELLDELDRYAAGLDDALCTTVACLLVDPLAARLTYSVAGHPFPFLRGANGSVSRLEGGRSVPLGCQGVRREEARHDIFDGESLLLYTDGLIERRHEHLDQGFARLASALSAADIANPGWCDELIDRCLGGSSQSDDIAVLGCELRMAPIELRYDLVTGVTSLAPLRRAMREWLAELDVDQATVGDLLVAAVEAASNAILHDEVESGSPPILVARHHPGRQLSIAVVGSGPWRAPGGHTIDGGRGLPLMRRLMDTVEIAPTPGGGTEVRMTKQLPRHPDGRCSPTGRDALR